MKRYRILIPIFISLIIAFATLEFRRAANATVRGNIAEPVYTVSHKRCSKALSSGKHVIKLGPMFWGLYRASVAFKTPEDARDYMQEQGLNDREWGVYRLSGDYKLDVDQEGDVHFINKPLMVIEVVKQKRA